MANISDPLDINMLQGGASAAAADSVGQEFVPEVWGQAILDKFRTNTVMLPLANDLSSEANGTDKIHLPHIGVTPLASVVQGTPIVSDQFGRYQSNGCIVINSESKNNFLTILEIIN